MKTFSILIPTRERPGQLSNLLQSIWQQTYNPELIEVSITMDNDDSQIKNYLKAIEGYNQYFTIRKFLVDRAEIFPEYYNKMAYCSDGLNLWVLNDDCEIKTQHWDLSALHKIQMFNEQSQHNIWYGDIGDSTRNYNNNGQYSCFPMLSKDAFRALGYFFNPKIIAWGTDKFLKYVFEQSGAGIINMLDIFVQHRHLQDDETHTVLISRLKSHAGQELQVDYSPDIQKLRNAIRLNHEKA